jgi:phosphatidate phosphatase APP1
MSEWKTLAGAAARRLEARFDRLRFGVKYHSGLLSPVEILPYRGYGTPERLSLRGRVLERRGITRPTGRNSVARNLLNMVRRFDSSEVPGARMRASFDHPRGMVEARAVADGEGFFEVRMDLPEPLDGPPEWHPVRLELLGPKARGQGRVKKTGLVLVPRGASFGVISDIDDTVVHSGVTNLLKMVRISLFNDARSRLPFEGVAAFYEALRRGPEGDGHNPIFYVSSSPWNLYDLLEEFLDVHGVPSGPMFLKDWSPTNLLSHGQHKLRAIRTLLSTYPELPFVLIGDSGERDPEICLQVVRENPGRVPAVYIRDVTTGAVKRAARRDADVREIAAELGRLGVEALVSPDTAAAAEHAAAMGLTAGRRSRAC